jgi:hypothetical protein
MESTAQYGKPVWQELEEELASALQPHADAVQRLARIPG